MYNGTDYPEILSGSGYVMSRSAAECLYDEGLTLPFFHLVTFRFIALRFTVILRLRESV